MNKRIEEIGIQYYEDVNYSFLSKMLNIIEKDLVNYIEVELEIDRIFNTRVVIKVNDKCSKLLNETIKETQNFGVSMQVAAERLSESFRGFGVALSNITFPHFNK